MSEFTVKQIADLANISVRTLHHYHDIGLLLPQHIGRNGYRYYNKSDLLRLQQILFYRAFGMGLAEISNLLDDSDFDNIIALKAHKKRLQSEQKNLGALIKTIDQTIENIQGDNEMPLNQLYKAFPPEKQAEYEAELAEMSPKIAARVADTKAYLAAKPNAKMVADMQLLHGIEAEMIANMRSGLKANAPKNLGLVLRHRDWVSRMWGRECRPEAHVGLAQMYEAHPDFNQRYEALAEGFTAYITTAIRAHSG